MLKSNLKSAHAMRKLSTSTLASLSLLTGATNAHAGSFSLSASERQTAVESVDPYHRGSAKKNLYSQSGERAINETKARLSIAYPYTGKTKVRMAVKPTENLVDGVNSFTPLFTRTGSMAASNKLNRMTAESSIQTLPYHDSFCARQEPGVKAYVIESEISNYDQHISNKTVGPATTVESGNYVGDRSSGSAVSRDSFYLFGRIIPCDVNDHQTVENLKVEVQSSETDQSVLVFAKLLGLMLSQTEAKSPGLNNAALVAQDALFSTLILKFAQQTKTSQQYIMPQKPFVPTSSRIEARTNPIVDEVVTTATKFRFSKRNYFPRSAERHFRCSLNRVRKTCNLQFDMPRRGTLNEMERYMRWAAEQGGAEAVRVNCSGNRKRKVVCSLKGNLTGLTERGFKKGLFRS